MPSQATALPAHSSAHGFLHRSSGLFPEHSLSSMTVKVISGSGLANIKQIKFLLTYFHLLERQRGASIRTHCVAFHSAHQQEVRLEDVPHRDLTTVIPALCHILPSAFTGDTQFAFLVYSKMLTTAHSFGKDRKNKDKSKTHPP